MFIFAEEKRQKLQQERPDLSDSEVTRCLARMWNDLPDKKKVAAQWRKWLLLSPEIFVICLLKAESFTI